MTITGGFPLLKTEEGCLNEPVAIAKYICALSGSKMLGSTPLEKTKVDQWISFANTTVLPCSEKINEGIFGTADVM